MKSSTKKKLMVFSIIIIFSISPIGYYLAVEETPEEEEIKFIIEGEMSPEKEQRYLGGGFTILKIYYSDLSPMMESHINQLPDLYKTNFGQIQLIVEKIKTNGTSYGYVIGPYNEEEISEINEKSIFNALCNTLYSIPLECGLRNITS